MIVHLPYWGDFEELDTLVENSPSGDSPIGKVLSLQPAVPESPGVPAEPLRWKLEQPRITFGVSALDNDSGPITLYGGRWNMLASERSVGGNGMRAGLVAYPGGRGRWGVFGHVQLSLIYPKIRCDLVVIQGVLPDDDFPNIMTKPFEGQPGLEVGGCSWHSPDVENGLFTMPINAPDVQCNASWLQRGMATEILVYVFPHTNPGEPVGGAMSIVSPGSLGGGVTTSHTSKLTAMRWNG